MKYTEEFSPQQGDRVVLKGVYSNSVYKAIIISIADDKAIIKKKYDMEEVSIDSLYFVSPRPWWKFWGI